MLVSKHVETIKLHYCHIVATTENHIAQEVTPRPKELI